jgi:hypothetical protein
VARHWSTLLVALALSASATASETCPIEVRSVDSGRGLQINGSSCTSDLPTFWQQVQGRMPAERANLRWFSIMGPLGSDNRGALSSAWAKACKARDGQGVAFLRSYAATPASRVLAPALAALNPVPESVDNFYQIKTAGFPSAIAAPGCRLVLLPPVIYYRLRASNNSVRSFPSTPAE